MSIYARSKKWDALNKIRISQNELLTEPTHTSSKIMAFENKDVQLEFFSPNLETSLSEPIVVTVGDGIESTDSIELDANNMFAPEYSIDITNSSIVYQTNAASTENPSFSSGDFNGVILSDVSNSIPAIKAVSIDRSATTLNIDASDIEFTEDTISINFEGKDYTPGEKVELDVEFESIDSESQTGETIQEQNLIIDNAGIVGSVNLVTGELIEILNTNVYLTDIDVDSDGNIFGIGFSQLYSIDIETGTTSLISSYDNIGLNALEISEDGTFYATSFSERDVFTLNPATGEAISIGTLPTDVRSAGDLQFVDDTLYLADTERLIALDISESTLNDATVVGSFNLEDELIYGITIDEDENLVGLTDAGSILTLDLDTGEATSVGIIENSPTINGAATLPVDVINDLSTNISTDNSEELSIQLEVFTPDLDSPATEPLIAQINDEVEYTELSSLNRPGLNLIDMNIDLNLDTEGGTIYFEVDEDAIPGIFNGAEFNGYVFTDISDQIPDIADVTINESINTLGLETDDITFTENTIEVNFERLLFSPEDALLLEVELADI